MNKKLSVLFVDDSLVDRRIIRSALERIEQVEIIGHASNGESALSLIQTHLPDVVFLDVQMPKMNGLEVLERIPAEVKERVTIFLLTSKSDAAVTKRAMELGVDDYIFKPAGTSFEENFQALVRRLKSCIKKVDVASVDARRAYEVSVSFSPVRLADETLAMSAATNVGRLANNQDWVGKGAGNAPVVDREPANRSVEVIVIAVSTGGPEVLRTLLPMLPVDLDVPVLVVQHIPAEQSAGLTAALDLASQIKVMEGRNGMQIQPGHVYLAPGGLQMGVRKSEPFYVLETADIDTENFCKPSADYLLDSAINTYGGNVLAIVMTGMGNDGTRGCSRLAEAGGVILTQEASSCVVYGMPRSVDEAGLSSEQCSIERIAERITMVGRKAEYPCTV